MYYTIIRSWDNIPSSISHYTTIQVYTHASVQFKHITISTRAVQVYTYKATQTSQNKSMIISSIYYSEAKQGLQSEIWNSSGLFWG